MRIMVLTSRKEVGPKQVKRWLEKLALGPDVDLQVVTVHPPLAPLPVSRVECVDPTWVPWRPVVPLQGERVDGWGGPRRVASRALRLARRVKNRLPLPEEVLEDSTHLAIACATSPLLKEMAESADVIVAANVKAIPGTWRLARRAGSPVAVDQLENVRITLERQGREIPPQWSAGPGASLTLPTPPAAPLSFPEPPGLAEASGSLLIAPANYAGQAHAWVEALRTHTDATGLNLRVGARLANPFPTDLEVSYKQFKSLPWRLAWRSYVMKTYSHVIIEANLPILGHIQAGFGERNAGELARAGIKVAMLSHGSDGRIPSVHAGQERWHAYDALPPATLDYLEVRAQHNVPVYNSFDGTVFISTPALAAFMPEATWLPLTIDVDMWRTQVPPLSHGGRPVVAHIPSSAQKGSHMIDPILRKLEHQGVIRYLRMENVPHEEMPAMYQSADLVVEQFGIADYSAAACESMAAGRVVVSRVSDLARDTVLKETGHELPVVEANPETLADVIVELLADPQRVQEIGRRGESFVREVHDGRFSARVLREWMG